MNTLLLKPAKLGKLTLNNRVVMAPMTRTRANPAHVPTEIMVDYYAQRSSAGLIISEATGVSANGSGYARMPGLYTPEQLRTWKKVTSAVHASGGKIFVQLMHTGRISHSANMDSGARVLAPSAIRAPGEIYTDSEGMVNFAMPVEMTSTDIDKAIDEFVDASLSALAAGFDGVEIHGANGYLVEQFLRKNSNQRTDAYGGSIENRARFLFEVVERVGAAIGFDKVGVRISPRGTFNDMELYEGIDEDYRFIAQKLSELGIVYLHVADHGVKGPSEIPEPVRTGLRRSFSGTYIPAGGYSHVSGEADLASGYADLIAIGKPFIANPDLVERFRNGNPLAEMDPKTIYGADEKGYSDYPTYSAKSA